MLICADAGGSNGNRLRAWKLHLQQLATEIGIPISVCHYPPGMSIATRILGLLLAAMAVQAMSEGLKQLFPGLGAG